MGDIWRAARGGNLAEVVRMVGEDPGRLNAKAPLWHLDRTPLMFSSQGGRVEVVRWLLDQGADIDESDRGGQTALCLACSAARPAVVKLLLERGADPAIADRLGWTPLMAASSQGHLVVLRWLLAHPSGEATVNHRNCVGKTALWWACHNGRVGAARMLLASGADPTIAADDGTTPMAVAKRDLDIGHVTAEGRRECVAALEVRSSRSFVLLAEAWRGLSWAW
jgi:uncharacterized protein